MLDIFGMRAGERLPGVDFGTLGGRGRRTAGRNDEGAEATTPMKFSRTAEPPIHSRGWIPPPKIQGFRDKIREARSILCHILTNHQPSLGGGPTKNFGGILVGWQAGRKRRSDIHTHPYLRLAVLFLKTAARTVKEAGSRTLSTAKMRYVSPKSHLTAVQRLPFRECSS